MPSGHRRRRDRDREALLQAALPQRPRLREHQRRGDRAAGEELRVEVEVDRPWQVRPHRLRPPGALRPPIIIITIIIVIIVITIVIIVIIIVIIIIDLIVSSVCGEDGG